VDTIDVLEFGSGLMISIDETVDEPNWLTYTERVADFSRLVRFDASGLGLSDPVPTGTEPGPPRWVIASGRPRSTSSTSTSSGSSAVTRAC
jgi:hypothetical protein